MNCFRLLLLTVVLLSHAMLSAQPIETQANRTSCTKRLDEIRETYQGGQLGDVAASDFWKTCCESLNLEARVEAYEILTKTYIYLQQSELADSAFIQLLNTKPWYKADTADVDMFFISRRFRTHPIATVGVYGGVNVSQANIIKDYSLGRASLDQTDTKPAPGLAVGAFASFPFKGTHNRLHAEVSAGYQQCVYNYSSVLAATNVEGAELHSTITFKESQNRFRASAGLLFDVSRKSWISSIFVNGSWQYLFSANLINLTRTPTSSTSLLNTPKYSLFNNAELRQRHVFAIEGGLAFSKDYRNNQFGIRLSAEYAPANLANVSQRYADPELMFTYSYIDNDFNLFSFKAVVTYGRHFYRPRPLDFGSIQGRAGNMFQTPDELKGLQRDAKNKLDAEKKDVLNDLQDIPNQEKIKAKEKLDKVNQEKEKVKKKLTDKIKAPTIDF